MCPADNGLDVTLRNTDAGSTYRPTERAHCKLVCVGEGELDGLGMCEGGLAENNNAN